jgi:nucleotide-binding universal stress UspA family protein
MAPEKDLTVLIALDESRASRHAAAEAARLFPAPGTRFLVVNVARYPAPWVPIGGFGLVSVPPPGWEQAAELGDETEVSRMAQDAGLSEPDVLTEVGEPVDAICHAADEQDADVVVVGAHHRGFISRLLSPSVSAGVLRRAGRPVLVVAEPPEPSDPEGRPSGGGPHGEEGAG